MKIQPITTWNNGIEKQLKEFILEISFDNLSSYANLQYSLYENYNNDANDVPVIQGPLTIIGEDYLTWDADPSANSWAYNWAAGQLNLVLIPE
jgi:hypothetical protein